MLFESEKVLKNPFFRFLIQMQIFLFDYSTKHVYRTYLTPNEYINDLYARYGIRDASNLAYLLLPVVYPISKIAPIIQSIITSVTLLVVSFMITVFSVIFEGLGLIFPESFGHFRLFNQKFREALATLIRNKTTEVSSPTDDSAAEKSNILNSVIKSLLNIFSNLELGNIVGKLLYSSEEGSDAIYTLLDHYFLEQKITPDTDHEKILQKGLQHCLATLQSDLEEKSEKIPKRMLHELLVSLLTYHIQQTKNKTYEESLQLICGIRSTLNCITSQELYALILSITQTAIANDKIIHFMTTRSPEAFKELELGDIIALIEPLINKKLFSAQIALDILKFSELFLEKDTPQFIRPLIQLLEALYSTATLDPHSAQLLEKARSTTEEEWQKTLTSLTALIKNNECLATLSFSNMQDLFHNEASKDAELKINQTASTSDVIETILSEKDTSEDASEDAEFKINKTALTFDIIETVLSAEEFERSLTSLFKTMRSATQLHSSQQAFQQLIESLLSESDKMSASQKEAFVQILLTMKTTLVDSEDDDVLEQKVADLLTIFNHPILLEKILTLDSQITDTMTQEEQAEKRLQHFCLTNFQSLESIFECFFQRPPLIPLHQSIILIEQTLKLLMPIYTDAVHTNLPSHIKVLEYLHNLLKYIDTLPETQQELFSLHMINLRQNIFSLWNHSDCKKSFDASLFELINTPQLQVSILQNLLKSGAFFNIYKSYLELLALLPKESAPASATELLQTLLPENMDTDQKNMIINLLISSAALLHDQENKHSRELNDLEQDSGTHKYGIYLNADSDAEDRTQITLTQVANFLNQDMMQSALQQAAQLNEAYKSSEQKSSTLLRQALLELLQTDEPQKILAALRVIQTKEASIKNESPECATKKLCAKISVSDIDLSSESEEVNEHILQRVRNIKTDPAYQKTIERFQSEMTVTSLHTAHLDEIVINLIRSLTENASLNICKQIFKEVLTYKNINNTVSGKILPFNALDSTKERYKIARRNCYTALQHLIPQYTCSQPLKIELVEDAVSTEQHKIYAPVFPQFLNNFLIMCSIQYRNLGDPARKIFRDELAHILHPLIISTKRDRSLAEPQCLIEYLKKIASLYSEALETNPKHFCEMILGQFSIDQEQIDTSSIHSPEEALDLAFLIIKDHYDNLPNTNITNDIQQLEESQNINQMTIPAGKYNQYCPIIHIFSSSLDSVFLSYDQSPVDLIIAAQNPHLLRLLIQTARQEKNDNPLALNLINLCLENMFFYELNNQSPEFIKFLLKEMILTPNAVSFPSSPTIDKSVLTLQNLLNGVANKDSRQIILGLLSDPITGSFNADLIKKVFCSQPEESALFISKILLGIIRNEKWLNELETESAIFQDAFTTLFSNEQQTLDLFNGLYLLFQKNCIDNIQAIVLIIEALSPMLMDHRFNLSLSPLGEEILIKSPKIRCLLAQTHHLLPYIQPATLLGSVVHISQITFGSVILPAVKITATAYNMYPLFGVWEYTQSTSRNTQNEKTEQVSDSNSMPSKLVRSICKTACYFSQPSAQVTWDKHTTHTDLPATFHSSIQTNWNDIITNTVSENPLITAICENTQSFKAADPSEHSTSSVEHKAGPTTSEYFNTYTDDSYDGITAQFWTYPPQATECAAVPSIMNFLPMPTPTPTPTPTLTSDDPTANKKTSSPKKT